MKCGEFAGMRVEEAEGTNRKIQNNTINNETTKKKRKNTKIFVKRSGNQDKNERKEDKIREGKPL